MKAIEGPLAVDSRFVSSCLTSFGRPRKLAGQYARAALEDGRKCRELTYRSRQCRLLVFVERRNNHLPSPQRPLTSSMVHKARDHMRSWTKVYFRHDGGMELVGQHFHRQILKPSKSGEFLDGLVDTSIWVKH